MFCQKIPQLLTKPSRCHEHVHLVLTLPESTNINRVGNGSQITKWHVYCSHRLLVHAKIKLHI